LNKQQNRQRISDSSSPLMTQFSVKCSSPNNNSGFVAQIKTREDSELCDKNMKL
jgi:hypothetical protein